MTAPRLEERSGPKEAETPKDRDREDQRTTFTVILKLMEGMQALQKQFLESKDEDREGHSEFVRGSPALPPLAEWNPSTAPIDLNDWLALIEPIMSDLTHSSGEWWNQLMEEATKWYQDHLQLQPLQRMAHVASPSELLTRSKWTRLEKRASTLLLMAVPDPQREELIASKKLSALSIVCQLLVSYKPGGLAEKELILRSLELPPEAASLTEAIQALRRWSRWRRRAAELRISEPDPYLLLKGLNRIIKKPLENNRELTFRISLARSMLQVDSTPSSTSVTSFAQHLLAEFEQIAHQESGSSTTKKKQQETEKKASKLKRLEEEQGSSPTGKNKERAEGDRPKCKFYLSDNGCKRGKSCTFSHDQKDDRRRCWTCGSPEHMAPACPRSKGTKDGSPTGKGKLMKTEGEDSSQGSREKEDEGSDQAPSMKELLTQANSMLKNLSTPNSGSTASSTSSSTSVEGREEMLEKLQQQINALKLKVFQINRINYGSQQGLVDSGATHPLRPLRLGETSDMYKRVSVTLANGQKTLLQITPGGAMVSDRKDVEPIIPMGQMTLLLGCSVNWSDGEMSIHHPTRGELPVSVVNGCQLPRSVTLDLIDEVEQKVVSGPVKQSKFQDEVQWMHQLVASHPVLRDLPHHIKSRLVVTPGEWNCLPANKRIRKRLQRDGMLLHLYAGEETGFTLSRAYKQVGGNPTRLLEIDIKRGPEHDMLVDTAQGVYASLLRAVLDDKLIALVGGPNCRSRSVLRHRPIPGVPDAPRPLREWGGQEHGKIDLSDQERQLLQDDDVLLWRMVFLVMVGTYLRQAKNVKQDIGFSLEQPASPKAY